MEIALLFSLILLNGVFAMSEIAMVTARRNRLQQLADEGDNGARAAIALTENPTWLLSTVQVGITSIGILSGILGEEALAKPLAAQISRIDLLQPWSQPIATGLVVVIITYFSLILGELVPKRIGQMNAESIARILSRPMQLLARIARPFVRLLTFSTEVILRLLGIRTREDSAVTEEDIHALIEEGADAGVVEQSEQEMIRNVFRLDDRQLKSLMTPRTDIVHLDVDDPWPENIRKILSSPFVRFPACRDGLEHLLGFVDAKRLLASTQGGQVPDLAAFVEPALYVPDSLTGTELLENLKAARTQQALVVDEYGHLQGLVTLSDLMQAIVGDMPSPLASDALATRRDDGSWLIDGMIAPQELKDTIEIDELPEEDKNRYHTLNGMLMLLLGRIPHTGDKARWAGWEFEVVDMDGRRIDKVLASRHPDSPPADPNGAARD